MIPNGVSGGVVVPVPGGVVVPVHGGVVVPVRGGVVVLIVLPHPLQEVGASCPQGPRRLAQLADPYTGGHSYRFDRVLRQNVASRNVNVT